jgi:lipopolysaccharide/colanic/teichoic acid biosynthesis glycosyltransferase
MGKLAQQENTLNQSRNYTVIKRSLDIIVAAALLVLVSPLLVIAAVGIKLTSPGPVLYPAQRAGLGGKVFTMLKFRTMHVNADKDGAITGKGDTRVFPFGRLLRQLKVDELPQFVNILRGDISLVGPRPEDPKIVASHYTPMMMETLEVLPGLTSPGAIFGYAQGEDLLDANDVEGSYVTRVLPTKLALERAYIDRRTILLDLGYIALTALAVLATIFGLRIRPFGKDRAAAQHWGADVPL